MDDDIYKLIGCAIGMVILAIVYYVAYRLLEPVVRELLPQVSDGAVACISVIVILVVTSLMRMAARSAK